MPPSLAKLQWQCRRGTVELDLILSRYLHNGYALASPTTQQRFQQLLQLEDDLLLAYLLQAHLPVPEEFATLVANIRQINSTQTPVEAPENWA